MICLREILWWPGWYNISYADRFCHITVCRSGPHINIMPIGVRGSTPDRFPLGRSTRMDPASFPHRPCRRQRPPRAVRLRFSTASGWPVAGKGIRTGPRRPASPGSSAPHLCAGGKGRPRCESVALAARLGRNSLLRKAPVGIQAPSPMCPAEDFSVARVVSDRGILLS